MLIAIRIESCYYLKSVGKLGDGNEKKSRVVRSTIRPPLEREGIPVPRPEVTIFRSPCPNLDLLSSIGILHSICGRIS